jgi:hypothetical protein
MQVFGQYDKGQQEAAFEHQIKLRSEFQIEKLKNWV